MSAQPSPASVALPTDAELVLKVIPMPGDCNANGDIFGGWVMAQVDLAGSVLPARHVRGRMATVAVNEFIFKQPVRVGDILSFFAKIVKVGRTSVTVKVEVFAERFGSQGDYIKVTEARHLRGHRRNRQAPAHRRLIRRRCKPQHPPTSGCRRGLGTPCATCPRASPRAAPRHGP